MKKFDARKLERVAKGFSNHRRIAILFLLNEEPQLSVFDISSTFRVNFRTISDHLRRAVVAGLVKKRNRGKRVEHELTPLGKRILLFLQTLEQER